MSLILKFLLIKGILLYTWLLNSNTAKSFILKLKTNFDKFSSPIDSSSSNKQSIYLMFIVSTH